MSFDITNNLNDKILDIINRCSYDMYVIHKYTNMICTCVNHETDQADVYCKKCLGTKYKISIRKDTPIYDESISYFFILYESIDMIISFK